METSEKGKTALWQQAEARVLKLLASLQELKEGALKELEQQVMETVFAVGGSWMECILSDVHLETAVPGQRVGSCGIPP